jgi:aspartate/methionine/tyrosine aminotransferase
MPTIANRLNLFPDFGFDAVELRRTFEKGVKALVLCNPSNPTGKVHDFLTVGAAAPLQEATVTALNFPPEYYEQLQMDYTQRRSCFLGYLDQAGLRYHLKMFCGFKEPIC